MAVSGSVTLTQDGGRGDVSHPYLIALVRWCMSYVWSTATVLLHRLMTAPLQPIAGPKTAKARPATRDHLHPEPKVECVVLYEPSCHDLDVIFVHGLYGSLGNTWRQGDWRSKYKIEPNKISLRGNKSVNNCANCRIATVCSDSGSKCDVSLYNDNKCNNEAYNESECNMNESMCERYDDYTKMDYDDDGFYKKIKKILPNDDVFVTEKFYNNTLLNQVEILDNYDTQAQFVNDLFKYENGCDDNCDIGKSDGDNEFICKDNGFDVNINECQCKGDNAKCEAGCGCVCDECYSPCWPRDWIRMDYPNARVISINYTSDPHLWRPLWVKQSKRLRLHERAVQMTQQLLGLGVGRKPIIWVGHSKGGLFIKQIYCEAYEAHLKLDEMKHSIDENANENNNMTHIDNNGETVKEEISKENNDNVNSIVAVANEHSMKQGVTENNPTTEVHHGDGVTEEHLNKSNEDIATSEASLWSSSVGFMFYSVPHRGSPLADFKTPITARSVELLEIRKDCALVLSLQDRWLRATASSQPYVRSLVETCRTLMSVLWLRIVSVDSADAGIGALCGVSVDHREICKPSSRRCLLYTELMTLMRSALTRCRCQ